MNTSSLLSISILHLVLAASAWGFWTWSDDPTTNVTPPSNFYGRGSGGWDAGSGTPTPILCFGEAALDNSVYLSNYDLHASAWNRVMTMREVYFDDFWGGSVGGSAYYYNIDQLTYDHAVAWVNGLNFCDGLATASARWKW